MRWNLILSFAVCLFTSFSVAAQPQQAPPPEGPPGMHGEHPHHQMCDGCRMDHMPGQTGRWTFTFSPAYFHQNRENVNPAFTSNGFSSPRSDFFGWEMEFRKQLDTGFQGGIEFLSADTNREQSTNRASYRTSLFGLYLGYRLVARGPFTVDIGSGIGSAKTELEVFSGTQNGRLSERAWYAQPSVGVAYTVSRHLRLGLSASYLAPFGQSEEVVGQDLVVRDIALQGFSAKIDLILGRF